MSNPKGIADRVQSLLGEIPGIRTYRNREHRRETDKRLREHLASRLQETRSKLNRLTLDLPKAGLLEPLDDLDRLSSRVQQMADTIRYASYGYTGIFSLEKIEEEQLDRLYEFDLSLLDDLHLLGSAVEKMRSDCPPESWQSMIGEAENLLHALEQKFLKRKDFLVRPS